MAKSAGNNGRAWLIRRNGDGNVSFKAQGLSESIVKGDQVADLRKQQGVTEHEIETVKV